MPRPSANSRTGNWSASTNPLGLYADSPTPRLYDRFLAELRARKLDPATERTYVAMIKRFMQFHNHRHPAGLNQKNVAAFLRSLADEKLNTSEREQTLAAVLFLYTGATLKCPVLGRFCLIMAERGRTRQNGPAIPRCAPRFVSMVESIHAERVRAAADHRIGANSQSTSPPKTDELPNKY
jgi:hypothetical protein